MLSPAAPLANADEMFHTRRQFVVTVTVTGWNLGAGDVEIEDSAEPPLFPHQQLEESEVALVKDLIGEGQYGYLVSVDDESIVATVDIGAAAHDDAGLRECLRAVGEVTASMPSVRHASLFSPAFDLSESCLRETLLTMTTKAVPPGGPPAAGRVEFDLSREHTPSAFSMGVPSEVPVETAPPFVPHDGDLIDALRQRLFLKNSLSFVADKNNKSFRVKGAASKKASMMDGEWWFFP
jgi:hypothetical protein